MRRLVWIWLIAAGCAARPPRAPAVAGLTCPDGASARVEDHPLGRRAHCERDGRREGPARRWHRSGALAEESRYAAGVPSGPFRAWHPNGVLNAQGQHARGVRAGTWRWWADDGSLWIVESYAGGRRSGPVRELYWNGRLKFEGTYVAGELEGEWRTYGSEGDLYEVGHAHRGRLTGTVESRSRDGALMARLPYVDNRVEGVATWYAGGRPASTCDTRGGGAHGRCVKLDDKGAEIEVTYHRNGEKVSAGDAP